MVDVYKEERKGRYIFMAVVMIIAIFLYVLVQMNALDDRKNEIKFVEDLWFKESNDLFFNE